MATTDPARRLHSIAVDAVAALKVAGDDLIIDEPNARALQSQLVLTSGSPQVEWAVRSLLIVASRLAEEGHRGAVDTLLSMCCVTTTTLAQIGSNKNVTVMRRAIERLAAFTAAPTNNVAPRRTSAKRHQRSGLIFDHLTARPVRA